LTYSIYPSNLQLSASFVVRKSNSN